MWHSCIEKLKEQGFLVPTIICSRLAFVSFMVIARQFFAEHYFRLNALRCTAMHSPPLIPAECSAIL